MSKIKQLNLQFLVDEEHQNSQVSHFNFDDFDTIMSRPSLESYANNASEIGRTNFQTTSTTIGVNMGEYVNTIASKSKTVREYQRDLREVKGDDVKEFHKNTFVYGQTNLVPIIVTNIDRILDSLERELNNLAVGTKENLEELLVYRRNSYEQLMNDLHNLLCL